MKQKFLSFTLFMFALLTQQYGYAYDFEVDGICYTVTSFENFIVEVDGFKSTKSGVVELPSKVEYNSKVFSVTCIASVKGANIETVKIPDSITEIKSVAFSNTSIKYLDIPDNIVNIGIYAFEGCKSLESIRISRNVSVLSYGLFKDCTNLKKVEWHPLESSKIEYESFENCISLKSFTIPSTCYKVGNKYRNNSNGDHKIAFNNCSSLDTLIIEDGIGTIMFDYYEHPSSSTWDYGEFHGCPIKYLYLGRTYDCVKNDYGLSKRFPSFSLDDLVIGDGVQSLVVWPYFKKTLVVGRSFSDVLGFSHEKDLEYIKIRQGTPPQASGFSNYIYINTVLFVPKGAKTIYESTDIWKNFWNIQEFNDEEIEVETKKCALPTISYSNGKLTFNCETEGAICQSTITDSDIATFYKNEVHLSVTYNISVYATKSGYENSEVATATLCWIDVEPKTEGIDNSVAQVRANAVLIQTDNGHIAVTGADDGTEIFVYGVNGLQVSSATSRNGFANIPTNLLSGSIAIIKIGDKSIKVVIK